MKGYKKGGHHDKMYKEGKKLGYKRGGPVSPTDAAQQAVKQHERRPRPRGHGQK